MKMFFYLYFYFSCSFCFSDSFPHQNKVSHDMIDINLIHEIKSINMSDIFQKENLQDTWYVFDLDNTVLTPDLSQCTKDDNCPEEKATDGFFYKNLWNLFEQESSKYSPFEAKKHAYRKAQDHWNALVQTNIRYRLLEKNFPSWIQEKVKNGAIVIGHTAREMELHPATIKQLKSLGVDFLKWSKKLDTHVILDEVSILHPEKALFQDGVFFVGRGGVETLHHKGKRFLHLLSYLQNEKGVSLPKEVFFFDDRREHVEGMMNELRSLGIICHGFHYTQIEAEPDL